MSQNSELNLNKFTRGVKWEREDGELREKLSSRPFWENATNWQVGTSPHDLTSWRFLQNAPNYEDTARSIDGFLPSLFF